MWHYKTINNKLNKPQEKTLRLVYNDRQSVFEELLDKDNSFSIHHRNLATKMHKVYSNDVTPDIMNDTFEKRTYHISSGTMLILPKEMLNMYIMTQI